MKHIKIVNLVLFFLYLHMGGYGCAVSVDRKPDVVATEPVKTIYLVAHDWHAGIVLRTDDVPDSVWPQHREFAAAEYLEVGWGDAGFYRALDPGPAETIKAAFLPTDSVLHLAGFSSTVKEFFPGAEIVAIEIGNSGFEKLCRFIERSYAIDVDGNAVPMGEGLYGTSRFYKSMEKYHICRTCNVWTANALKAAGLKINSMLSLTVDSLMARSREFGVVIQQSDG